MVFDQYLCLCYCGLLHLILHHHHDCHMFKIVGKLMSHGYWSPDCKTSIWPLFFVPTPYDHIKVFKKQGGVS